MRRLFFFPFVFGALAILFFGFGNQTTFASHSNIDFVQPNHWAWNDVLGWIDFCDVVPGGGDCTLPILVDDDRISGYASSSVGFIELDCATSPTGGNCPSSNWFVSNDSQGGLAGYAWNDAIGWISFCGDEINSSSFNGTTWECPDTDSGAVLPYQVVINGTTGDFTGYAWNDVIGWISFNCANPGTSGCGGVDYKVNTSWRAVPPALPAADLISATFDTCALPKVECGAAPNSIMWQGNVPPGDPGVYVRFQIASSNALGGPWNFIGPDPVNPTSFYQTSIVNGSVSTSIPINHANHQNQRYFRYRIFLAPCNPVNGCNPPQSPIITDVSLNWSP